MLQVWTIKGVMVFEKPMDMPVANWNICGNKLVFMEDIASTDIYLVKLFLDKEPVVFKFKLPSSTSGNLDNSYYDATIENLRVPEDIKASRAD